MTSTRRIARRRGEGSLSHRLVITGTDGSGVRPPRASVPASLTSPGVPSPGDVALSPETALIALPPPFDGWEATVRLELDTASLEADLDSGDLGRVEHALNALVLEHNFPDERDEIAASLFDVDSDAIDLLLKAIVGELRRRVHDAEASIERPETLPDPRRERPRLS